MKYPARRSHFRRRTLASLNPCSRPWCEKEEELKTSPTETPASFQVIARTFVFKKPNASLNPSSGVSARVCNVTVFCGSVKADGNNRHGHRRCCCHLRLDAVCHRELFVGAWRTSQNSPIADLKDSNGKSTYDRNSSALERAQVTPGIALGRDACL